jgi:phage shock protein C
LTIGYPQRYFAARYISMERRLHMSADTTPRLHRSATDRVVAGVCGGLAEYLEVDPTLVRLAFIVGTLWGGLGVLIYLILAVVLPVDPRTQPMIVHRPQHGRNLAGAVLILLGAVLLAGNLGWAPWLTWSLFWPAVLVFVGAALLLRSSAGPSATE